MQQPTTIVMTTAIIHAESREQKESSKMNKVSAKGEKNGKERRNDPFGPSENVEVQQNEVQTLKNKLSSRSASCDPIVSHPKSPSAKLKSVSPASLGKGISCCYGSRLQKGSSIVITHALIHIEKGGGTREHSSETNPERPSKDFETPQETAHHI